MNRLIARPWLLPGLGTILYLAGFNDAAIAAIGDGWLELGRALQTIVVLVLLGLIAYLVTDRLNERRSAYEASIRAASVTDRGTSTVDTPPRREPVT